MKRIFFLCIVILLFCGCDKDKVSKVVIIISSEDSFSDLKSGDKVLFRIHSFANEDVIKNITVTSSDVQYGMTTVFDTLINGEKFDYNYLYTVPDYADSTTVRLIFEAFASDNTSSSMSAMLRVKSNNTLLPSFDGIIMYAAHSNNKNGFNVSDLQTLYCETTDPSRIDIYDYSDSLMSDTVLSREWRSETGLLFARFNDFNFATATKSGVVTAFEYAAKYTSIKNLTNGDVILLGKENTAVGVIQVIAIYDDDGSANDRYVFNFKKIP
ncbi:MAG: hypothetical protein LBI60_07105 [Bacteroidales bacterium]|jgi:hypothetical protein|nr:hypothetical protein [Bacteroidales bacterium]